MNASLSPIQKDCLNAMGIMQWVKREVIVLPSIILADYTDVIWLYPQPAKDLNELLVKMVTACKLSLQGETIEYTSSQQHKLASKIQQTKATAIVLLGKQTHHLVSNHQQKICLPDLAELSTNPTLKRQAWQSLQRIVK